MTDRWCKTELGRGIGRQNISCLSMNSLDVRKLVLLVKYAVVEIILMMTQRALILIPHPVSRQHPEPVDKFPFIDVLSAALFLFPSKHVEGQTNSYKTELNASLFQEGCRQGAKRAVRECNVINEHGCSVRIGFSTQDASSPRNTILKLRLLGFFLFVLLFFFIIRLTIIEFAAIKYT